MDNTANDHVREHLAEAAFVEMPDRVTGRIERRIREEARVREGMAEAEEAKADYVQGGTSADDRGLGLGTFGENPPRSWDKPGLGMEQHDREHHPHVARLD